MRVLGVLSLCAAAAAAGGGAPAQPPKARGGQRAHTIEPEELGSIAATALDVGGITPPQSAPSGQHRGFPVRVDDAPASHDAIGTPAIDNHDDEPADLHATAPAAEAASAADDAVDDSGAGQGKGAAAAGSAAAAGAGVAGASQAEAASTGASSARTEGASSTSDADSLACVLDAVSALRAQAATASGAGDWEAAAELYQKCCGQLGACAGSEDSAPARAALRKSLLNVAHACTKLERWEEARDASSEVIRVDPACATAYYRRGLALLGLDQPDAAQWDLQRASKLLPGNARVSRALGRAKRAPRSAPADAKPSLLDMLGPSPSLGGDGESPMAGLDGLLGAMGGKGGAGGDPMDLLGAMMGGEKGGKVGGLLKVLKVLMGAKRRFSTVWKTLRPMLTVFFYVALLVLPIYHALLGGAARATLAGLFGM